MYPAQLMISRDYGEIEGNNEEGAEVRLKLRQLSSSRLGGHRQAPIQ